MAVISYSLGDFSLKPCVSLSLPRIRGQNVIRHAISFIKLYTWDGKWEGSWQRLGQQSDLGARETQLKNKGKKLCMEVFTPHCHAVQDLSQSWQYHPVYGQGEYS